MSDAAVGILAQLAEPLVGFTESAVGFDLGFPKKFLGFLERRLHEALVLRQAEHGPLDEDIVFLDFCQPGVMLRGCFHQELHGFFNVHTLLILS